MSYRKTSLVSNMRSSTASPIAKALPTSSASGDAMSAEQLQTLFRKGDVPNTPLPPGWSWKFDKRSNRPYFLNHIRKGTSWEDPRPLPHLWSMKVDANKGRPYFLNHTRKATQWTDPRPFPPAESRSGLDQQLRTLELEEPARRESVPKAAIASLSAERQQWRQTLLDMGFDAPRVNKGLAMALLDTMDKLIDWITEGKLPPASSHAVHGPPALERAKSSDAIKMLRAFLLEDKKNGMPLTTEQYNLILMEKHKGGDQYECQVCYGEELGIEEVFCLDKCKHFLCQTCMEMHIVTLIKSMKASSVTCPMPECKEHISHTEVKRCISEEEHERYQEFLLQDALKKDPACRWCPKPGCETAMIGDPNTPLMRCPKAECNFSFCFNCKEKWHTDLTCAQYQAWKKDNGEGYAQWAAKNTKPCPKCHVAIQKNGGCNHMKCVNCRDEFCWLCQKSVLGPDGKYKIGHWALDESSPCHGKMHT